MTDEERIKKIEELGIKRDELGLVPLDVEDILTKPIHSNIDAAVNSVEEDQNSAKLEECIRNSNDNDVISARLLHDVIANCEDFHSREFLNDIYDEVAGDFLSFSGSELTYGSGVLDYIRSFVDEPLSKIAAKYAPYLDLLEEETSSFEERWEEHENEDNDVSYNEDDWADRAADLNLFVNDLSSFCEAAENHFETVDCLDNDYKLSDSCSEIDKYLDTNFYKVFNIRAADFDKLVDAIVKTAVFKNASDYVRKSALAEVVKYSSKYNVSTVKEKQTLPEIPDINPVDGLEDIEEMNSSRRR